MCSSGRVRGVTCRELLYILINLLLETAFKPMALCFNAGVQVPSKRTGDNGPMQYVPLGYPAFELPCP